MLRGHRSIHLSLFANDAQQFSSTPTEKKGRNQELYSKRNELLVHRYYYYSRVVGKKYVETLYTLEQEEFFIAQRTIVDTIQLNYKLLSELNKAQPDRSFFKKKYPFMIW